MKQSAKSYTMDLLNTMIAGMISSKESKGFKRLHNGLFEDCLGQVYSVELVQSNEVTGTGDEAGVINHVKLSFKPVSIAGRF